MSSVFLWRVLGVFDGPVGPEAEPFRMLTHPRMIGRAMIGRALDGEIQRHLHTQPRRSGPETAADCELAEFGVDGAVAALRRTDRVGTSPGRQARRPCCCPCPCD